MLALIGCPTRNLSHYMSNYDPTPPTLHHHILAIILSYLPYCTLLSHYEVFPHLEEVVYVV
jgi:hypothetical protein